MKYLNLFHLQYTTNNKDNNDNNMANPSLKEIRKALDNAGGVLSPAKKDPMKIESKIPFSKPLTEEEKRERDKKRLEESKSNFEEAMRKFKEPYDETPLQPYELYGGLTRRDIMGDDSDDCSIPKSKNFKICFHAPDEACSIEMFGCDKDEEEEEDWW